MKAISLTLLAAIFMCAGTVLAQPAPGETADDPAQICRFQSEKGDALLAKDDKASYDEAAHIFKKAIEAKYDCVPALIGYSQAITLGRGYEMSFEEYSRAYEYITRALVLDPKNARACWVLADLVRHNNRLPAAASIADQSLQMNPNDPWAHYVLASALMTMKPDEAISEFQAALKLKPNWQRALLNLGATYMSTGKLKDAEKTFNALVKIDPGNVSALTNLGIVYFRLGNMASAEENFKKALTQNPNFPLALKGLGDLALAKKDFATAINSYLKYLDAFPRDAKVLSLLGQAQEGKSDIPAAKKSYESALQLNPDDQDTKKRLAALSATTPR